MKGITQQDLFIKTGIQQWKISNFERGIIPINNEEKARIEAVLQTKIDWNGSSKEN